MGLIKSALGAAGGVLADQWKEFFYCDSIDNDVLVVKGRKRVSGRSSNTRGEDNIISNGSGIAVADGQCMMIVEQSPASSHGTAQANRAFSPATSARALSRHLKISANASHTAAAREKTREFTTSTLRK